MIDTSTELGARQANYIRLHSGRHHTAAPAPGAPDLVTFTFPAGQRCFQEHRVLLERDPRCYVRGGDWRGQTSTPRVHARPVDWVDDFAEHQDKLKSEIERG